MKSIFLYCIAILSFNHAFAQSQATPVYYTPVNMPAFLKGNFYGLFDTRLLAEDLAGLLTQATGKSFTPQPYKSETTNGIFLILDSTKKSLGSETGSIDADGKNYIRFTAGFTTGISYAMYSWLDEIGFHFYLPGDNWTIIPSGLSVFNNKALKKTYKPSFKMRLFNPSGGIQAVKGLDENLQNWKDWQQWYLRNRMGCEYIGIGGHVGEAFNVTHKKEIENDSLILAPVQGKRTYAAGGKIDPTYEKGVDMFTDWITNEFKSGQTYPDFLPFKKYYSADAGDGVNYCHTAACESRFQSVSDQVFSIVNAAAKKIKLADPRVGISTLAYAERADTPGIRIESNVHTMVVASAYQSVGTAVDLMKRWAKKSNNISVYDYLNIDVWSFDKPFFNMDQYYHYLRFLKSLKTDGITFETSLSKFSSGILQYFILAFLNTPYTSVDDLLNTFCKDNFGPAAAPVKKLFKEWYFSNVHLATNYDYPSFYEDELGRFIKYIGEAENSPGLTPAVKRRVQELKAYTVYLCKFYLLYADQKSIQAYVATPQLRHLRTEELLTYTWQLYRTKIFHNTQLNEQLKKLLSDEEKQKWNYSSSDLFKNMTDDPAALIATEFERAKQQFLPLVKENIVLTDSFFEANAKYSADSIRITTTDENAITKYLYPISFYCSSPGILKINYATGSSIVKNRKDKIALVNVESNDYAFTKTDLIYKENSTGTLIYNLPAKGQYRLYLSQYNQTHLSYVIYPGNNLFYHNKKSVLTNSLSMQENTAEKPYPNKYLAIYAAREENIFFSNYNFDSKNTSLFYPASGGAPLVVQTNPATFTNTIQVPKNQPAGFIFFENSSYRSPPVLKSAAPYYFFLRFPAR